MSLKISKTLQFPQSVLQFILTEEADAALPILGGILSNTRYAWHARGPCLEVRNTKTGSKIGSWTFGCILRDSNTRIVCVEELQRLNGMLSLLVVGINCTISGGLLCIFDIFSSKVIRAIQIKEKITSIHVIDSGCEVLNLPGPLRNFDGIVSIGTKGGNVFLLDICRQICEEALCSATVKDELDPCQLTLLTLKDIPNIEYYKEKSVRDGDHLAIHLNVVLNSSTLHFTLKGPKGDDRIFVNREEVETSALYYCSQLTSLLVGFNFGAFQLWDLTTLNLIYTSAVCEEHLPIVHFALQEPADDPRAFCYIWAAYSNTELFQSGLPFAVMYSLCYESKEYHEGYGYLYQDFQSCSIRFQLDLGLLQESKSGTKVKGGLCMALQPICKTPVNKDLDILALCAISWTVWCNQTEVQTFMLLFDLNQWYKEQMPNFPKSSNCSSYILKLNLSDLITVTRKSGTLLDVKIDNKSLRQFAGVQRLEEHFCPNALTFDVWGLRESDLIVLHNEGLQKALLKHIEASGPLCLIRPNDLYRQVIALGLTPLFTETTQMSPSTEIQREIILNVALEHQLVGWLCKCASEWANGSFSSAGCSLDFLIYWAFQRAVFLKTHCDKYCMPLFDYSRLRLDNNTSVLLNSCIRQINNLSVFYLYILNKLPGFISNIESVVEQQTSLKMVSIYFEVLQWLVNVGLLPECHLSAYPRNDAVDHISAPYPVQELTEFYNKKRAQLQMLTKETFIKCDSLLFIDNLVDNKCGAAMLQKQWQDDGGSGLYPPPSLQSLLRTYLVEGADISHKHSLIIYLFLDLAMALDQNKYASVITHLIKFPAVFKVSSSIIKITQAFWQLDHGDFTTAMEQLLDPFVLGDDLQPWHHAIAMRTLLLQHQYNFALLYMQVRKPPINDENDVFTAISLFVANNMLDEAFYFKNQHLNSNEEQLLKHLFNECNKNESLHVLLYRCLNNNEEKTFFKYLKETQNPTASDLQVFYYLLRSRFIEAFDTHQICKKNSHESQGLLGQKNASKTDQIVKMFKTLLPDVNKNLVDTIRKERTNLWKEVITPTPMSVFVHDSKEQVKYKSTVIHAALAKAKCTFNDTLTPNIPQDIVTEDTPFLRTPTISRTKSRHPAPIITPKIVEVSETGEELCPSPPKRLKLTPRTSASSPKQNQSLSIHSKMLTPIVKRKTSYQDETLLPNSSTNVCTPQSILKVRNLVRQSDVSAEDTIVDSVDEGEILSRNESHKRKSSLYLLPRKLLSRSYRKPHVQFDDAINVSSSFSDQSIKPSLNDTSLEHLPSDKSLSSKDVSLMVSSKNSSTSNPDDVFYSPNSSLNESSNIEVSSINNEPSVDVKDVDEVVNERQSNTSERTTNSLMQSPKARRSYKRPFAATEPIRSSPRINRYPSQETENKAQLELDVTKDSVIGTNEDKQHAQLNLSKDESVLPKNTVSKLEVPSIRPSPRLSRRFKGRRSLNRQVLEYNTFSKEYSPSVYDVNKSSSKETTILREEKTGLVKKTQDGVEISIKSKEETVYEESISEKYVDTETSTDVDFSFSSPVLPGNLIMSDSLEEYVNTRVSKFNINQTPTKTSKTVRQLTPIQKNINIEVEDSSKIEEEVTCSESMEDTIHKLELPSIKQSPRVSQRIKGRKSLGRQVLEFNTFSKVLPPPSPIIKNNSISKETTISREEKRVTVEKTQDTPKITTNESKEETTYISSLSNASTSNRLSTQNSVYKEKLYEEFLDSDTSTDFDFSFSSPALPSHLILSDSLEAYVNARTSKISTTQTPKRQLQRSRNQERIRQDDSLIDDVFTSPEPMEVYEDLSSGAEDVEEVLAESKLQNPSSKIYAEQDPVEEDSNGSLENVLDPNETREHTVGLQSENRRTTSFSESPRNSDSIFVPETEKGFLDDSSKVYMSSLNTDTHLESENAFIADDESPKSKTNEETTEVIEIGSSSDEQDTSKEDPSETSESKSSERSYSDEDELNIAYEHNIHVEENSRSLDSETSRNSNNSVQNEVLNFDNYIEARQVVIENVLEEINDDNELEINADSSSDLDHVDQQSSDESMQIDQQIEYEVNIDQNELQAANLDQAEQIIPGEENKPEDGCEVSKSNVINDAPELEEISHATCSKKLTNDEKVENKQHSKEFDEAKLLEENITQHLEEKPDIVTVPKKTTVDRATNTTIFAPAKDKNVAAKETAEISEDNLLQQNNPETKTYSKGATKKVVSEHQTTSSVSSDTTDGEVGIQEIVVKADVHTPVVKTTETFPTKRITRRSSALLSQTSEPDILENVQNVVASNYNVEEDYHLTGCHTPNLSSNATNILEDAFLQSPDLSSHVTPGVRTRRSRSMTTSPSRLSQSKQSQKEINDSKQPQPENFTKGVTRTIRRTRRASADEVIPSPRKRSLRSCSVSEKLDEDSVTHKSKSNVKTASILPVITEEKVDKEKLDRQSKDSSADNYATTRRLTRRQASLIKDIKTPSSVTVQDASDIEKILAVDEMDPIKLLDKESFHGPPDPEEQKVYEPSSPSTSTTSSVNKPVKHATRSASVASDISAPPSTPKRRTRVSIGHAESPSAAGVKTRSRTMSETSSVTSEKSDQRTPPKKSKKDKDEPNSVSSVRSTRSRANSTSSVKSDTSTSSKIKPRGRRLASTRSDLPEIAEENIKDTKSTDEKPTKRSTRKRSAC